MVTSYPKNRIKILLLENIHPVAREILEEEGFQVDWKDSALSEEELEKLVEDVHAIGIRSKTILTDKIIKKAPKLLTIGAFCIGTNQIDCDFANGNGIPVFNAPYSNSRSVAELVIGEMVALSRKLGDINNLAHKGEWHKSAKGSHEVRGKTLGIVGYGHIGSQLSVLAESFGMRVFFYDIVKKLPLGNSQPVSSLRELLGLSDFVSLHVPATPDTHEMMGKSEFDQMKPDSFLINASRGTVVKIEDLAEILKSGKLAGAAVDVFPKEPRSNKDKFTSPLQGIKNVILTPHIGGSTEEAQEAIGREVAESFMKFINAGDTAGAVNFPNVDLPIQKDCHRILNVHKNVPGVMGQINSIVSEVGANIKSQYLATDPNIGYLVMDLEAEEAEDVLVKIRELKTNIKTRILF